MPTKRSVKRFFVLNNQKFQKGKKGGRVGETEEMVSQLRVLIAFAEGLGLGPSTHLGTHNQMKLQFQGIGHSSGHLRYQACMQHTDMHMK